MNNKTLQRLAAISLMVSALLGVLIMVLDTVLPGRFLFAYGSVAAPVSHVQALIGMIIIDVIASVLVLVRARTGLMVAGIWGALQLLVMAANPIVGPSFGMSVSAFASYLFGLPEYDVRLAVQVFIIYFGWRGYLQFKKA